MFIEKNGLRVKLEWRHHNPDFSPKMSKEVSKDSFVGTECICTITSTVDNKSLEVTAKAKLRPGDAFCKDLGRRFSAHRVFNTIRHFAFPSGSEEFSHTVHVQFRNKEFRTAIWHNYLNETNPKLAKILWNK